MIDRHHPELSVSAQCQALALARSTAYYRPEKPTERELHLRRRLVIPVPVLTPRLSSLWIHLVTPLHASIARPLAEGLKNRVVCRDDEAERLMPHPPGHERLTIRQAMDAALDRQLGIS